MFAIDDRPSMVEYTTNNQSRKNMKGYSQYIKCNVIVLALLVILISLSSSSCRNIIPNNLANNNSVGSDKGITTIISDNDSIRLYMVQLPSTNEYIPGKTEIWYESKQSGDKHIIVTSTPECYGRITTNDYDNPTYYKYPNDSIPSIINCIVEQDGKFLIIEGPTCDAGYMATFRVDIETGDCHIFPSNYGFVGFANWSDNVIVSSKYCDIDYDLVLWYEVFYIIDSEGNIVNKMDTKVHVIEEALPFIHHEAGLELNDMKLVDYKKITPTYKDDSFWGNRFECKYLSFTDTILQDLDSLVNKSPKWAKEAGGYRFYDVDYEYGMFMTLDIDNHTHTGIITKGAFGNRLNAPKSMNQ